MMQAAIHRARGQRTPWAAAAQARQVETLDQPFLRYEKAIAPLVRKMAAIKIPVNMERRSGWRRNSRKERGLQKPGIAMIQEQKTFAKPSNDRILAALYG